MTPTEHPPKTPSPRTGIFALLSNPLRAKGIGASFFGRANKYSQIRHPLFLLPALITAALFALPGTALAAPPETPQALKPAPLTATTATLHGILNPGKTGGMGSFELDTYEFVYRQNPTECNGEGEVKTTEGISLGGGKEAVSQAIENLLANAQYTVCLVAHNEAKTEEATSTPLTFTTLPVKPTLAAEVATGETATSADLQAQIDPNGAETAYVMEYGTSTEYGKTTSAAHTGFGRIPVLVSQHIESLSANTEYHWRLVATNAAGTTTSPDHTFVYQTTGEGLPDNRAYELVTPVQKNGGLIGDVLGGFPPNISQDGSRVIALAIQCFVPAESCNAARGSATNGEPVEFTRTQAGWVSTALAPSATQFSENSPWLADANEGTALFSMPTGPAQEDEWYVRQPGGAFVPIGPATPPGKTSIEPFHLGVKLSTADLSHLVWQTRAFWSFDNTKSRSSIYEYVGTGNKEPFLVGVSNTGQPKSNAEAELISTCATGVGNGDEDHNWNALSANGHTVYFTAFTDQEDSCVATVKAPPVRELFARVDGDAPGAHTVAISQPNAPETLSSTPADDNCSSPECQKNITEVTNWRPAEFWGASTDGSRVFFLSEQQLTDQATQGAGGAEHCDEGGSACNLYLYDFGQPEGHKLIDVSASSAAPEVRGVVATSSDGSHVYFIANGVLAPGAGPGDCHKAGGPEEGSCNLYVYERDASYPEGHTAFIASLPGSDATEWSSNRVPVANVTPDGRFLVFPSHGDLTPDDTRGAGYSQIFRYDAQAKELLRISIGNNGFADNGNQGLGEATIVLAGLAAAEPYAGPQRGDPTMSNDGSYVFFQSPVALTPHALNDVVTGHTEEPALTEYAQNVYEWHAGHVYLISDGRDAGNTSTPCGGRIFEPASELEIDGSAVCLLGTDTTGSNVFFTTADQLVPADTDTQVDIYDARVCEPSSGNPCIAPEPRRLPPCGGEACHGIPAATPSGLTPGTASFNGEGNVLPPPSSTTKPLTNAQKLAKALSSCRKKYKKQKRRRAACERQAHKAYGAAKAKKSAKKATNNRRAGR